MPPGRDLEAQGRGRAGGRDDFCAGYIRGDGSSASDRLWAGMAESDIRVIGRAMTRQSIAILCLATLLLLATPGIIATETSTLADSITTVHYSEIALADGDCDYIGNSNTHKFHVPGCSWVPKIDPEHVVCFSSASKAISAGYDPCKKCHPA